MSVFVKLKIKPKNQAPQVNQEREIMVNSDAILTLKLNRLDTYDVTIKPEYWNVIANAMNIDLRLQLEYSCISAQDAKILFQLGKEQ